MNSTHTATTATIVTKPQRFCAGYYTGTITAGGLTIDYCLERCDEHNSDPGERGRWLVIVGHDCLDTYATMREAFASIDRDWHNTGRYGLC